MKNRVFVFGLVCLLSHSLKAMDDLADTADLSLKEETAMSPATTDFSDQEKSPDVDPSTSDTEEPTPTSLLASVVALESDEAEATEKSGETPKESYVVNSAAACDTELDNSFLSSDLQEPETGSRDTQATRESFGKWLSSFSSGAKITAGVVGISAVVWMLYRYGCCCCKNVTSKTIVAADTK